MEFDLSYKRPPRASDSVDAGSGATSLAPKAGPGPGVNTSLPIQRGRTAERGSKNPHDRSITPRMSQKDGTS